MRRCGRSLSGEASRSRSCWASDRGEAARISLTPSLRNELRERPAVDYHSKRPLPLNPRTEPLKPEADHSWQPYWKASPGEVSSRSPTTSSEAVQETKPAAEFARESLEQGLAMTEGMAAARTSRMGVGESGEVS